MNPLFVLTALFASAYAAPAATLLAHGLHGVTAPVAHGVQHVGSTAEVIPTPLLHKAQPVGHIPAAISLPAPHLTYEKAADVTTIHKPDPIITKQTHLGQTTYVSGYATQILKPAIPDFQIAVPTALKGTVSHNAPIVHVEKEIHTVNQPVHVEKPYEVPYDVIKHVEKIVEVPTPVHVSVPVPVEVPHPVLGEPIVKKIQGPPVVRHHHNHVVAQPALVHHAAHVAHPFAAAPIQW